MDVDLSICDLNYFVCWCIIVLIEICKLFLFKVVDINRGDFLDRKYFLN